jgi:hypothetical protein
MQHNYTKEDIERFWGKVEKSDNQNDCWNWKATLTRKKNGYGMFSLNADRFVAHRISFELKYGDIPEGMLVCHKCDNTKCVNPNHLFLGTQKENLEDMRKKNRGSNPPHLTGEKSSHHILTDKQVEEIRKRYQTGKESLSALGRYFGVHPSQISHIVLYKQRT